MDPAVYAFGGLPAAGKSTLARRLARKTGAVWIRIDTLEQGLRRAGVEDVGGHGYALAVEIGRDVLEVGGSIVVDCVNPCPSTRRMWTNLASDAAVRCFEVEIYCSDEAEHRRRVEQRRADIEGLLLPTWAMVQARDYRPWPSDVRIDTAGTSVEHSLRSLLAALGSTPSR